MGLYVNSENIRNSFFVLIFLYTICEKSNDRNIKDIRFTVFTCRSLLTRAVVPDFVLEGVVKHKHLPGRPSPPLINHAELRPRRGHKPQVGPQPAVGGPHVGPHVDAWAHHGELHLVG